MDHHQEPLSPTSPADDVLQDNLQRTLGTVQEDDDNKTIIGSDISSAATLLFAYASWIV